MLVVKTILKEINGKGIGVIADEEIKKGQKVWVFNKFIDIKLDDKDVPDEAREFFDKYAVEYKKGKIMININNCRFINHSEDPNIIETGVHKPMIAIKEINKGEEITVDYASVDVNPLDF